MLTKRQLRTLTAIVMGFILSASGAQGQIFSSGSLDPDAISPNGDDVQDFTVINYTIADNVEIADVRVLLEIAGSGGVVDTLQAFTLQGTGPHTIVFDGTISAGQVADGFYEVKILGVGTQGEGTETLTLALEVDRVPPDIQDWSVSSPGPILQNGDILTMQACVDGATTPSVDLSAIDSEFHPDSLSTADVPPNCTRFTYTISLANTLPDASLLPALLVATDRAGNTSTSERALCLSNTPPVVVSAQLLNPSPFLQNGDIIRAEMIVDSPLTLSVNGDFSSIDSGFQAGNVNVIDHGGQRFELQYRISDTNSRPDGDYAIRLLVSDEGCGFVDDSRVIVTLDNAGINSSLIDEVLVSPVAFSPAGSGFTEVTFHFSVKEDSVTVSIATDAQMQDRTENVVILFPQTFLRGDYTVDWDGSGTAAQTPDRLVEQDLTVVVRAISVAKDKERNVEVSLAVDRTPPQLLAFPDPNSLVFTNGVVAEIPLTWDGDEYTIEADFSQIDTGFDSTQVVVTPEGNGEYTVFYGISAVNSRPDAMGIPVVLTAVDLAGNISPPISLVRGCVNNLPPELASSELVGNQGPFNNGDRIILETVWTSEPHQTPPVVTADFSAIDDRFDPVDRPASVIEVEPGKFQISYSISPANNADDGVGLPIRVTAADDTLKGCGSTTVIAATIELDNESGIQPSFIYPAQDTVVVSNTVLLTGSAPGGLLVEITRNGTVADTFDVDPAFFGFSDLASLEPGDNRFQARSIDEAGNISTPSPILTVSSVQSTTVVIPPRFAPGDFFSVGLLEPSSEVVVRIFSLEGVEIQRLVNQVSSRNIHEIPWDGKDATGRLGTSGPCLAVVDVHDDNGSVRERVRKAFVFTRHGSAP